MKISSSSLISRIRQREVFSSPCASLCALGEYLQQIGFFTPFYEQVQIVQKASYHDARDKLLEVLICALRGAPTVYEINTLVRPYPEVWQAFGLRSCAEQSTVAATLDACTQENVAQFRAVMNDLVMRYSQTVQRMRTQGRLMLEMDLFGLPTGATAEQAAKGYFPRKRTRVGHQLVRVTNPQDNEILGHWLFSGNITSAQVFKDTVGEVEHLLQLDALTRAHILWRVDAGFGTDENINWALWRNYQLLAKGFSGKRATKLAQTVKEWEAAPSQQETGRAVGKILVPIRYGRRTQQWSVRVSSNGGYKYATLITTLSGEGPEIVQEYDHRAGSENRARTDMAGLGLGKRKKKRWPAQQIMMLIVQLAHNILVWQNSWFHDTSWTTQEQHLLNEQGIYRIVHQRLNIDGRVLKTGRKSSRIELNPLHPFSPLVQKGFQSLLEPFGTLVILGKI
jgi:hypothetical protein